jgi:1,4-dihydroxy-2-naphthoate octaprenyltransferase
MATPNPAPPGVNLLVLAPLAMGYTVPPLKFSHRGLGELVVAVTHSIGVILPGYLLQGGDWHDPLPWLLSLPLGLAVLPAIILSGVPDYDADAASGKNTLVVKLGIRRTLIAATLLPILTIAAVIAVRQLDNLADAYGYWIYLAVPHAAWLIWQLLKYLRHERVSERIDGLMVLALTFILWFGVIPLIRLW